MVKTKESGGGGAIEVQNLYKMHHKHFLHFVESILLLQIQFCNLSEFREMYI